MLRLRTGRNHLLQRALLRETGRALAETDKPLMVVVPKQLTLETELSLLEGLNLQGSFRLRVLSPERLCGLIFDAAGRPEGTRIDERGRVMLVAKCLKNLRGELTLYRGALSRRGFAVRAAKQLEALRQAGLSPENLSAFAEDSHGALSLKLQDLSSMLSAYERAIEGQFQDGESEFRLAAERVADAEFLTDALVWFYGFDMMPPTLHGLIAAVSARADTAVLLPLESDTASRDFELFQPLQQSVERLVEFAREKNARISREAVLEGDMRAPELKHLGSELFAYPARPWKDAPNHVQLFEARSPREEARFAAALARKLVRTRGWRFNDVRVLCPDLDSYRQPLSEAFSAFGVPVFLAENRPCSRHALAECLLTALRLISRGLRNDDLLAYISTGYPDISADEADRLKNYAISYGLKTYAFFKPLRRGPEAVLTALEPVRMRAMEPVIALRTALKRAENLREQLAAIFEFLQALNAYEKGIARQKDLADAGLFELAGEEAQVWNRLLGALDQMDALLGPERLSIPDLADRLSESLDAVQIKPLPQYGDAVYVQALSTLSMRSAKAVIVLGQVDRAAGAPETLLTDRQLEALSQSAKCYIGQTASDLSRSRLFYIKAGIEMATDYACITYPLTGSNDSAERPGILIKQLKDIFPEISQRGGVTGDERVEHMLLEAPRAAIRQVALALSQNAVSPAKKRAIFALCGIPEARTSLQQLSTALDLRTVSDRLSPGTAQAVFRNLQRASVSRLETFAGCPFSHFMRYGINPIIIEPYALTPRDEGVFFHDAMRGFLVRSMEGDGFDLEKAEARMDQVAEALLKPMREGPLGQSSVSMAEEKRLKGVARMAARLLTEQLEESGFRPVGLELRFGPEDGAASLKVGSGKDCTLYGSIDRLDEWTGEDRFLRILDYKRGTHTFDLAEAYCGLQLQLLVYLAAAAKKRSGKPAGAFYFRMDDGYVLTQETAPEKVDKIRHNQLRMEGLLPRSETLRNAMSPNCDRFFKTRSFSASSEAMERLTERALDMAGRHVDAIRLGEAAPSPVRTPKTSPCKFCNWKAACLFDEAIDKDRLRRLKVTKAEIEALLGDR